MYKVTTYEGQVIEFCSLQEAYSWCWLNDYSVEEFPTEQHHCFIQVVV